MNDKRLLEKFSGMDVYVYGAGRNAARIYEYLLDHGIMVRGFLVSDIKSNPKRLFDVPVFSANEFKPKSNDIVLCSIVFGIGGLAIYREVMKNILALGWERVIFFSKQTFEPVMAWLKKKQELALHSFLGKNEYYIERNAYVEPGHSVFTMAQQGKEYRWRVEDVSLMEIFSDLKKMFPSKSALEECQELFGEYIIWDSEIGCGEDKSLKLDIYMTRSHVDAPNAFPNDSAWIHPIQVGAALTDKKLCELQDNQGENISDRNSIYSEGTALYWMWKNAKSCDYIGLCHYRRHIDLKEHDIAKLSNVDALVTLPTFAHKGTRALMTRYIADLDIELLLKAVEAEAKEYLTEANRFFEARFYPPCNLFVMRYDVFMDFAKFLFTITFRIEREYSRRQIYRHDRYMGYLIECLMGIYLMHHKDELRIAYTDMIFYK